MITLSENVRGKFCQLTFYNTCKIFPTFKSLALKITLLPFLHLVTYYVEVHDNGRHVVYNG